MKIGSLKSHAKWNKINYLSIITIAQNKNKNESIQMKARSWQRIKRTGQQTFMLSKQLCGLQGGAHAH